MTIVVFSTTSGTRYILNQETKELLRLGVRPLRHIEDGSDMDEPSGEVVNYQDPPTVGESFVYYHPTLFGCISTPVVEITEMEPEEEHKT